MKKPKLTVTFDHGQFYSMIYEHEKDEIIIRLEDFLTCDIIDTIEECFWEKNPVTFVKQLKFFLKPTCEEITLLNLFNNIDVEIIEGKVKYNYTFKNGNLI